MEEMERPAKKDEVTIKGDKVFEESNRRGDLLDKEGKPIQDGTGIVKYRVEMPKLEPKKPSPSSNN